MLEKMINQLQDVRDDKKQFIIKFVKCAGYTAMAREIEANRNAKKNALCALNCFLKDNIGKRYEASTSEVVWSPSSNLLKQAEIFKASMTAIINETLRDNTPEESTYLKLKLDYDNACYNYYAKLSGYEAFIDSLEGRNEDTIKLLDEYSQECDRLQAIKVECENKLDAYVMGKVS